MLGGFGWGLGIRHQMCGGGFRMGLGDKAPDMWWEGVRGLGWGLGIRHQMCGGGFRMGLWDTASTVYISHLQYMIYIYICKHPKPTV